MMNKLDICAQLLIDAGPLSDAQRTAIAQEWFQLSITEFSNPVTDMTRKREITGIYTFIRDTTLDYESTHETTTYKEDIDITHLREAIIKAQR